MGVQEASRHAAPPSLPDHHCLRPVMESQPPAEATPPSLETFANLPLPLKSIEKFFQVLQFREFGGARSPRGRRSCQDRQEKERRCCSSVGKFITGQCGSPSGNIFLGTTAGQCLHENVTFPIKSQSTPSVKGYL